MGTPDFAVPSLDALLKSGHRIEAVVTQPDRPRGRGKKLALPPVKIRAVEAGLTILQPEKIKTPEFITELRGLNPELIVVVAFGQLLSGEILAIPDYGCINVHASLLPEYRGAAPIHWAVINGETKTGVTIMQMDEGLDSGDMILSEEVPVDPEDTTGTVHDKLAKLGAQLLVEALDLIATGRARRIPQDHKKAGYAPLLTKEVEKIDWSKPSVEIFNRVRGLNPWPGAYTLLADKVLKVWKTSPCSTERLPGPIPELAGYQPGEVLGYIPGVGFAVATGNGCIAIEEVQLQGSRRMKAEEFLRGHELAPGTRLS